jgi:hypothetical protein
MQLRRKTSWRWWPPRTPAAGDGGLGLCMGEQHWEDYLGSGLGHGLRSGPLPFFNKTFMYGILLGGGSAKLKIPNTHWSVKRGGSVKPLPTPLTPTIHRGLVKPLLTNCRSVKAILASNARSLKTKCGVVVVYIEIIQTGRRLWW